MFYRVVIQGRTLGGADVEDVKRHFIRVTGLPEGFADNLFGGVPRVIKRKVPQSDAERIAATLRAIGAAATVERENVSAEDETPEGIRIEATPLSAGPPSIIPGMAPAAEAAPPARTTGWLRTARAKLPAVVGAIVLIGAAVYAAPYVEGLMQKLRRAPTPVPAAAKPAQKAAEAAPAAAAGAVPLNPTLAHGPWRCVDQNTGTSEYWTYEADGRLVHHGNVFKEAVAAPASPSMAWKIDGRRLLHTSPQQATHAYNVTDLTLMRLRYGNEKGLDIQCRRP